jgi:hypothetical protein
MQRSDVYVLLLALIVLGLVSECSYQRGVDDTIEWYEEEESEGIWETSSSLNTKSAKSGNEYSKLMSRSH